MCNRYSLTEQEALQDALFKLFGVEISETRTLPRRYNVAPREKGGAPIIRLSADGVPEIALLRWGFVPTFDEAGRYDATNARAQTAFRSNSWRSAVQTSRCVVPADGFYEFKEIGKIRQGYRATLKRASVFFMPGVHVKAHGRWPAGFAFFTTEPNELIAHYHDRQPVILAADQVQAWLSPGPLSEEQFRGYMRQVPAADMTLTPVSRYVNKVGNEGPECFSVVTPPPESESGAPAETPTLHGLQAELF